MTENIKSLFLGGPHGGQWAWVPDDVVNVIVTGAMKETRALFKAIDEIPEEIPVPDVTVYVRRYIFSSVKGNPADLVLFAVDDLTDRDVLHQLTRRLAESRSTPFWDQL